jgi:hypothetical protein
LTAGWLSAGEARLVNARTFHPDTINLSRIACPIKPVAPVNATIRVIGKFQIPKNFFEYGPLIL